MHDPECPLCIKTSKFQNMTIGYIKINGEVSGLYINKTDPQIKEIIAALKKNLEDQNLNVEINWDNIRLEKPFNEILKYIGF